MPGIVAAMFSNATVDRDYAPYGLFLLRISLGFDWLVHAFLKISRGMYTHEALLAKNGITPLLAWPTFGLEVIGGVAILLGWYTRQWAAFLLIFLAVVVWIKWPVGWGYSKPGGGWEYPMLWLVAQAVAGTGGQRRIRVAIDVKRCTAQHCAAQCGLKQACRGAPLY